MKKKFDLNIKILLLIISFSSVTAIIYNTLSSRGISILKNPKEITWAEDKQLMKEDISDSIENKNEIKDYTKIGNGKGQIKNQNTLKEKTVTEDISSIPSPKAVNLKQAYSLYKSSNVVFIDARDKWDFGDGHIKGSVNIPYYKFENNDETLKKIKKSQLIITYCDGDDCEMSKKLAQHLLRLGYTNVYFFFGGWEEWMKANYPIEKSENL